MLRLSVSSLFSLEHKSANFWYTAIYVTYNSIPHYASNTSLTLSWTLIHTSRYCFYLAVVLVSSNTYHVEQEGTVLLECPLIPCPKGYNECGPVSSSNTSVSWILYTILDWVFHIMYWCNRLNQPREDTQKWLNVNFWFILFVC